MPFWNKATKEANNLRIANKALALLRKEMPELDKLIINGGKSIDFKFKPEEIKEMKKLLNSEAIDRMLEKKLIKFESTKSIKEIFYNFLGMNEDWHVGRNILGGFMVHAPEYPTYIIPAYTQAKATGDASSLKRGEGPRGLITGMLEGVAVGALVSGKKLNPKEMGPYILLGAGMQLFSATVFPWLGEKIGQYEYRKNNPTKDVKSASAKLDVVSKSDAVKSVDTQKANTQTFKAQNVYPINQTSGLKV